MFNFIANRVQKSLAKKLQKRTLNEEVMKEALQEIRRALLEADVNFKVVKEFINNVKKEAEGYYVEKNLDAYKTTIKIFHDELVNLLGKDASEIKWEKSPTKIMMVGLQGSGKTTTTGKLAMLGKNKKGKKPLLVANDIYRPAAIDQLRTLSEQVGTDFFEKGTQDPVITAQEAIKFAKENKNDLIIFDTAGRLHIDDGLMLELKKMKNAINPDEIILVVDAMTGQDIINVAKVFNETIGLTGTIITKLDSDARGGAALSITHLTKVPIKFIGTGEKLTQLDLFHPDRMANRILGMGDVVSLVEKAQDVIDEKQAKRSMTRMLGGQFDLEDFRQQLEMMASMGSMGNIMKMMPGSMANSVSETKMDQKQKEFAIYSVLMSSMTKKERRNPKLLDQFSRRNRVLKGSGRKPQEIMKLLKEYKKMKEQMKKVSQMMRSNKFSGMDDIGKMFGK